MNRTALIFLPILLLATPDTEKSGIVHGTVKSAETGELLARSEIYLYSTGNDSKSRFIETPSGSFTIIGVPPGTYSCFVSHTGYRPIVVEKIPIRADRVTELNFALKPSHARDDSTGSVYPGRPGLDYKMRFYRPDIRKYR